MAKRAEIELTLGTGPKGRRRAEQKPLRFLILSELSGQANDLATISPRRVAIERFDELLAAIAPALTLGEDPGTGPVPFRPTELDQFHPDFVADRAPELRELLSLRNRLRDPALSETAISRLAELTGAAPESPSSTPAEREAPASDESSAASQGSSDELFERLLGRPAGAPPRTRAQATVDALIKGALGETATSQPSAEAKDAETQIADLLNERCRALLTEPAFRSLERAWRSVHWLVSRLEEDEAEVFVLDIGKATLADHLAKASANLDESWLARALIDDEEGWDLLIGDYSFELAQDDIVMLATLGALCARANAPFLAHGDLSLAGCRSADAIDAPWDWSVDESLGALWTEFRQHPAAAWIGLATPRFVLRYPFGARNDPVERFDFEELPARPAKEQFLWGNPAFACALLMGQAHTRGGAEWPNATGGEVQDLPTPLYDDGTGDAIQPPLEALLNERARAAAMQHGLIVLAGGRNSNHVAATRISSLADA